MVGAVAIGVAVVIAFFAVGYGTRRYWVALLPLALPAYVFVAVLAGDDEECREFCGPEWAAIYGVAALIAALLPAGAAALGVRLRNRAS